MKSSLLMMLIGGAVIVAGGGYLILNNSNSDGANEEMSQQAPDASGTFASVMQSNKDLECSFEYNDGDGNVSSGIVYMTKGAQQIRGDFNIQQSGAGAMEMHVIRSGGYNYIWGPALPQGIKTRVEAGDETKLIEGGEEGGGISEDTSYYCESWTPDQNKFSLPVDIEFSDISARIEGSASISDTTALRCVACNQIPAGSGREQCLAALSCN